MSDIQQYVLGFAFIGPSVARPKSVVLIRKNKPDFQKGRLNGVGGKVEPTDRDNSAAMSREFLEETGAGVHPAAWTHFADMAFSGCMVHCYTFSCLGLEVKTMTDEEVYDMPLDELPRHFRMSNLDWLIPMAIDRLRGNVKDLICIVHCGANQ